MIYEYTIDDLRVRTGDLICTTDGGGEFLIGQFWRIVGKLIPGDVDHISIYIGPEGRCIEAGAKGRVIEFEVLNHTWDSDAMFPERNMIDTLYGIAYPLAGLNLSDEGENEIREQVASYCMKQAKEGKYYNLNFLDSETEESFYCSQLIYKAYMKSGIDLNSDFGMHAIPGTNKIIFPQEIWDNCETRQV